MFLGNTKHVGQIAFRCRLIAHSIHCPFLSDCVAVKNLLSYDWSSSTPPIHSPVRFDSPIVGSRWIFFWWCQFWMSLFFLNVWFQSMHDSEPATSYWSMYPSVGSAWWIQCGLSRYYHQHSQMHSNRWQEPFLYHYFSNTILFCIDSSTHLASAIIWIHPRSVCAGNW